MDQKVQNAMKAVVEYNWSDERLDFEKQFRMGDMDESGEGHIFSSLVDLDNALNGTNHKPVDYIDNRRD